MKLKDKTIKKWQKKDLSQPFKPLTNSQSLKCWKLKKKQLITKKDKKKKNLVNYVNLQNS
jgi:hypothetical protein